MSDHGFHRRCGRLRDTIRELRSSVTDASAIRPGVPAALLDGLSGTLVELEAAAEELHQSERELSATRQALKTSEQRFRSVVETASDAIISLDSRGQVVSWNRGAETMFGYSAARMVGQSLTLVMPERFRQAHREGTQRFAATQKPKVIGKTLEMVALRADGHEFPIELAIAAWRTGKDDFFTGIIRDITERKRAEDVVRQAHAQLETRVIERTAELRQTNENMRKEIRERKRSEEEARTHQALLAHVSRLGTMGEMASAIAHEVNQPLCAILICAQGGLRMLQSGADKAAEIQDAMEQVVTQAKRAAEIIRRLKDFSRKREPHRSTIDLNEVVREAVQFVAAETRPGHVTMRFQLGDDLPFVLGDAIQIEQVIVNLVRNAIESMDSTPPEQRELDIATAMGENDGVEFAVRDSGRGLPLANADRVFEPFFTTKKEGMGIGLPLSRSVIEAHGGRLWAVPNPDRGTTFRFWLPAAPGPDPSPADTSAS